MVNRKKAIINWLKFERSIAFEKNILNMGWYKVKNENIFFKWDKVAEFYEKHWFYKKFLKPKWIIWNKIISFENYL